MLLETSIVINLGGALEVLAMFCFLIGVRVSWVCSNCENQSSCMLINTLCLYYTLVINVEFLRNDRGM